MSALTNDLLKMLICFVFGVFIASVPTGLLGGPQIVLFAMGYGGFLALPALALAMLVYVVFHKSVHAHPNLWCIPAPFVLAGCVMSVIYGEVKSLSGTDPFIAALVFIGAVAATTLFRTWVLFPKELKLRESLQKT